MTVGDADESEKPMRSENGRHDRGGGADRGGGLAILGALMLVTLAGGVVLTLLNPATFRGIDAEAPHTAEPPDASPRVLELLPGDLLSGDWMASYQEHYEQNLPLRNWAGGLWGLLRYRLFREGGDGVLVGDGGWLFTSEEFAWYEDGERQTERNIAFVRSVRDRLRELDIELLVAPVPAKARVYPQQLGRHQLPDYARERYPQLLAALEEHQVPAADLAAAFRRTGASATSANGAPGEQLFLRSDTHWSAHGARTAARAVAEAARPVLDQRGVPMLRSTLHRGDAIEHRGDLVPFLGLGPFVDRLGPAPERVVQYEVAVADAPAVGLFDDVPIPVTLVGTSYSAGRVWSFEQFLKHELAADVLNLAEEGRGPFLPMRDYLEGDVIHQVPPQLVIWEIPERYLPVSYDLDSPQP